MPRKITMTDRMYDLDPGQAVIFKDVKWGSIRVLASRLGKAEDRKYVTSEDRKTGDITVWRLT